jgi:hypothetical protein
VATQFSNTLFPSNAADANFRAWVQFIHDLFTVTGGWVQTGDTGQANPATISTGAVTTANTKFGYIIYRMDDALQATAPVFVRVDFGNGVAISAPGMWFTIGTGSDGSGNITTPRFTPLASATIGAGTASTTGTHTSYGSADTNRICAGLFNLSGQPTRVAAFNLERTHDANGNDTDYGLIFNHGAAATPTQRFLLSNVIVMGSAPQPPQDSGLNYILPSEDPGTFGADIGVGIHIPIAGLALYPAKGAGCVKLSSFAVDGSFPMTLYGSSITYIVLATGVRSGINTTGTVDPSVRAIVRFD